MTDIPQGQGSVEDSTDFEPTRAMVEAGAAALRAWLPDGEASYFAERAAEEVYLAMRRAERAVCPELV
jgi:hypothetical protein